MVALQLLEGGMDFVVIARSNDYQGYIQKYLRVFKKTSVLFWWKIHTENRGRDRQVVRE